jgi:hypothetical protein
MSKINDRVLSELLSHQLKKVDTCKKLTYSDMVRVSKYLKKSIFNNECVLWEGYITNYMNKSKGIYVNFYFRQKKYALHRLLYLNFIGPLDDDEYLKFTCNNKGICCNINHIMKINNIEHKNNEHKNNEHKNNIDEKIIPKIYTENSSENSSENNDFIIDFN